jgi:ABC-type phosphate/phosphonate transport system ATPase subunit
MAILCSLHQTDLALEFADRIIAMSNGIITLNKYVGEVQENELESVYT